MDTRTNLCIHLSVLARCTIKPKQGLNIYVQFTKANHSTYQWKMAGRGSPGSGSVHFQWWSPDHQEVRSFFPARRKRQQWPSHFQSPGPRNTASPWCHGQFHAPLLRWLCLEWCSERAQSYQQVVPFHPLTPSLFITLMPVFLPFPVGFFLAINQLWNHCYPF